MGIVDDIYVCDFCGEDTGKFDSKTGNHVSCEKLAELRFEVWVLLEQIDLFGKPIPLNLVAKLRSLAAPDGEVEKKTLGRTPREHEHFCACGHSKGIHCATACANGGCDCDEYKPAQ